MRHQSRIFMLVMVILTAFTAQSQNITVTGKVKDSDGLEVIGANVRLKQAAGVGTVTNIDGAYTLQVKDASKAVLVFSYVGMLTKEVPVKGKSVINVTLESDAIGIKEVEVVAVGYGTARRKDLTGSISSVGGAEIGKVPVANVTQAMAGKIAGVQVVQSQGSPDADVSIRVRGGTSITQSNEPLYIVDGFTSEYGLKGIDPSDIASIDVLKDASATAIYGSAGANGVILITTKQGSEGKATVNYDMFIGFKKLTKRMDLLTNSQFVGLEYERALIGSTEEKKSHLNIYSEPFDESSSNLDEALYASYFDIHPTYDNRPGINWQDQVFDGNNPLSMNHKVSVSGGSKTSIYNVSYSRSKDDGIMENSGLIRNNIRARFSQQLNKRARFGVNLNYSDETTDGLGSLNDVGYFSRMQHIIQYRPVNGKYRNDNDLLTFQVDPELDDSGNQMQNPLVSIKAEERQRRNKYLIMNGELSIKLPKNITYRGTVSIRDRSTTDNLFYYMESRQALNAGAPYGTVTETKYEGWQYNNTLSYAPKLRRGHTFDWLIGQEDYRLETKQLSITNKNFPRDNMGLEDISLGTDPKIPTNSHTVYRKISFFTRANYQYKGRYLATLTLRADGSNLMGENNKYGYFPAASLAWRVSEESWMESATFLSNLKLRVGYGCAGNDRVKSYSSLSSMTSSTTPNDGSLLPSYSSSRLANPNLKWETNITANIGLDFGFLDQRLQGTIDIYKNNTRNLLLDMKVPHISGYATTMRNVGKTENRGIEFSLTSMNIRKKDFYWETSLNLAHNKNEVVKLADTENFTVRSGWVGTSEFNNDDYMVEVGRSLGSMYGYELEGLYTVDDFDFVGGKYVLKEGLPVRSGAQPGSWKFKNTDGNDVIDSNDRKIIGNANPDLIGGITNNFSYKGFDLSFAFNFQIGGDVYNANKMYFTKLSNRRRNSLSFAADRFTYVDPATGMNVFKDPERLGQINQGATMASIEGSSQLNFHSGYIEDASFLRLNNVTFGYSLPKTILKKAYISSLRVYASAYNLWTLTNYSGFDPEVNVRPNGGLTPGIDWGAYPRSLSFVFGLNLAF